MDEERLTNIEQHVCSRRDQLFLCYWLYAYIIKTIPASVGRITTVRNVVTTIHAPRVVTDSVQVVDIFQCTFSE